MVDDEAPRPPGWIPDRPISYDPVAGTLAALRATVTTLPALLRGVSEARARSARQGEWSILQVVSHLVDAENRYFERTRRMRTEERPHLPFYPDDDYSSLGLAGAVAHFRRLREAHVELLAELRPEEWQRVGVHALAGEISIRSQAVTTVAHDAEHLGQIARRLL